MGISNTFYHETVQPLEITGTVVDTVNLPRFFTVDTRQYGRQDGYSWCRPKDLRAIQAGDRVTGIAPADSQNFSRFGFFPSPLMTAAEQFRFANA